MPPRPSMRTKDPAANPVVLSASLMLRQLPCRSLAPVGRSRRARARHLPSRARHQSPEMQEKARGQRNTAIHEIKFLGKLMDEDGLKHLVHHGLRATCITRAAVAGTPESLAKKLDDLGPGRKMAHVEIVLGSVRPRQSRTSLPERSIAVRQFGVLPILGGSRTPLGPGLVYFSKRRK
jgi:hypothetical protein